jgi:ssDNA-binding Zn-finger/Zn-ribbon topoisomerase 1
MVEMALWGRFYAFCIGFVILAILFVYFNLRKDKVEAFRCPKCDFLVDAKDIERYGNVCPDCRTDWRAHPLKKE